MITSTLRLRMLAQTVLAGFIFVGSICFAAAPSPSPTPAGATDEKLFKGMQWRQIGPFRGGRALTIEEMEMWFWWRCSVTRSVQIRSAEFFGQPMAAKRGRRFYQKTKTPVA